MNDFSIAISFIASHFYMVDEEEFLKASREIQYKIISCSELLIESEDSLFDIISQIIERKTNDKEEISDVLFLEEIEFVCLSEEKFVEFISVFDFNEISGQLWQNLCQCVFPHRTKICKRYVKKSRIKKKCSLESIIVCGTDNYSVLGEKPNNKDEYYSPIIYPPVKLSFDHSSLLSYSVLLFRKHPSKISSIFVSKTAAVASSLLFRLFAVYIAHFTCFQNQR